MQIVMYCKQHYEFGKIYVVLGERWSLRKREAREAHSEQNNEENLLYFVNDKPILTHCSPRSRKMEEVTVATSIRITSRFSL